LLNERVIFFFQLGVGATFLAQRLFEVADAFLKPNRNSRARRRARSFAGF
jgi:hypothetical protein